MTDGDGIAGDSGSFQLLGRFDALGAHLEVARSRRSGLTVCVAETGGPLVRGAFALATEAADDDGLPHTLEHLIFLGSRRFPYKGALDMIANRSFAQGTNAWTATDHTACVSLVVSLVGGRRGR